MVSPLALSLPLNEFCLFCGLMCLRFSDGVARAFPPVFAEDSVIEAEDDGIGEDLQSAAFCAF